jgi:hypothetical protein
VYNEPTFEVMRVDDVVDNVTFVNVKEIRATTDFDSVTLTLQVEHDLLIASRTIILTAPDQTEWGHFTTGFEPAIKPITPLTSVPWKLSLLTGTLPAGQWEIKTWVTAINGRTSSVQTIDLILN